MSTKKSTFPYDFFQQYAKFMNQGVASQAQWMPESFMEESNRRLQDFMEGVKLYQALEIKRQVQDPPVIWAMGSARVLDYSTTTSPNAPILFVVPSLINRAYVLDLVENNSFLRKIAHAGIRPYLLDWGELSNRERTFTMDDYVQQYLLPALDHVQKYTQQAPIVLGYCMGGLLAMTAVSQRPETPKLALLATPWDFHAGQEWLIPWLNLSSSYLNNLIDQSTELPVEVIQYMFAMLNPLGVIRKFRELPNFADNLEKLQEFASVEDWLNDCTPIAPQAAKELLFDWYRDNKPRVDPSQITQPVLIISPQEDKIVPPKSSEALTKFLPNHHMIRPETGHIGAIIGKKADSQVIEPLIRFIK